MYNKTKLPIRGKDKKRDNKGNIGIKINLLKQ